MEGYFHFTGIEINGFASNRFSNVLIYQIFFYVYVMVTALKACSIKFLLHQR